MQLIKVDKVKMNKRFLFMVAMLSLMMSEQQQQRIVECDKRLLFSVRKLFTLCCKTEELSFTWSPELKYYS